MAGTSRKASYRDHAPALAAVMAGKALPPVVFIHGTSEYLISATLRALRARAEAAGAAVQSMEAPALTEAGVAALGGQGSLFEASSFYLIRRVEQAKGLPKILKHLPKGGLTGHTLCLVLTGETVPAALKPELTRLGAREVPCMDPWPSEMAPALQTLADGLGLKLKADAVQLLVEANGTNLVKQYNELSRIALSTVKSGEPLAARDLAPHLGMLREDDSFQLDKLLLARQWAKAHALAGALLNRGEQALGLLWILTSHCRTAIRVAEGAEVRISPYVLKGYTQAIRRGADTGKYVRTLELCQDADVRMKSGRVDGSLLIGRIIEELAT